MFTTSSKYFRIYYAIIDRAKARTIPHSEYTESHHIIPRSLGGHDADDNIVELTAREHYIAHRILIKITEGAAKRKMTFALLCFNCNNPKHPGRTPLNSHAFSYYRALHKSLPVSIETRNKISAALRGRPRSADVCKRIGDAHRGKLVSAETRAKQSIAKRGHIASDEARENMSIARKGKVFTDVHCRNISKAYIKTECRSLAIAEANKAKRKPCTVDGITIFASKHKLEAKLGRGIHGSRSPTFRFLEN